MGAGAGHCQLDDGAGFPAAADHHGPAGSGCALRQTLRGAGRQCCPSAIGPREALLDLYCGVGLFTLPLAMRAAKVIGIESNPSATADAGRNLAAVNRHRPNRAQIITAAVADGLKRAEVAKTTWDAIVLV